MSNVLIYLFVISISIQNGNSLTESWYCGYVMIRLDNLQCFLSVCHKVAAACDCDFPLDLSGNNFGLVR